MFGLKPINTRKADPYRELKVSIESAITAASKAGLGPDTIADLLSVHVVSLNRQTLARQERMRGNPVAYDGHGRPIDIDGQVAKAEVARAEKQRLADEAEYKAAVERRAARDEFLR